MPLDLDPITRKELVLDKIIITGLNMAGGDGKGSFATETHQHSYTHAFGDPERREGIWLLNHEISTEFLLPEHFTENAYQLKLLAMMEQWQNKSVDIAIFLNGHLLRRGGMLFENIATGWPANFLDLPNEHLRAGQNILTFQNHSPIGRREALFINQVEILRRPLDAPFQLELAPKLVRVNEPFHIRIRNTTGKPIAHKIDGQFKLLSHKREGNEDLFSFQTPVVDNSQSIMFSAAGSALPYQPERIVHAAGPYELLVGTDFDDDRHDETTTGIIDFFQKTEMGNIIGFRPKLGRTCFVLPDQKLYCQWFDFIKSRNLNCWLEDAGKRMPYMTSNLIRKYPKLLASKYHEVCLEIRPIASSLRDLNHAYTEFKKLIAVRHAALALPDRPFWLSSCTVNVLLLALSDLVALPIAEPSSHDHVLLYSAIRRTSALHNKPWGAHIPLTWYLGNAHSEDKLRRFQQSLHLAHLMGAKLIYSESGLFKFVQYHRRDMEHPISQQARAIMRNFYRYTRTQQPQGNHVASINLLYGNLDCFYFCQDHIPLDTGRSSDRYLWYKWPFTDIDRGWLAAKNIFRPLPVSELKGYPGDTGENRFSSNPYGSVDIIPLADLNKNPLPLTFLLGRNIMTKVVHQTLTRYVKNGGTLFLSIHHFNTNPAPDQPPIYFNKGNFTELAGITLKTRAPAIPIQKIQVVPNDILSLSRGAYMLGAQPSGGSAAAFPITPGKNCTILAMDSKTKSPVLIAHRLGKGRVICYTGETPMGSPAVRAFVDDLVQSLGQSARPDIHITNDAPIYLQQYRFVENKTPISQLFLLNVNWKFPADIARADLVIAGKTFRVDVLSGPPTLLYHLPTITVGAASPLTQTYNFHFGENSVSFTVAGKNLETFTVFAHRPVKRIRAGTVEIPFSALANRPDILQFSCNLNTPQQIIIEH